MDRTWQRQSRVEQIAAKDKTFAENFRALVWGNPGEPVRGNVERWLIRAHYRRQEQAVMAEYERNIRAALR